MRDNPTQQERQPLQCIAQRAHDMKSDDERRSMSAADAEGPENIAPRDKHLNEGRVRDMTIAMQIPVHYLCPCHMRTACAIPMPRRLVARTYQLKLA